MMVMYYGSFLQKKLGVEATRVGARVNRQYQSLDDR